MPLNAVRFVRKMRGGAQAHLLEADDGRWYEVKFLNNPQGSRILVNELVASSREFLEEYPEVHFQMGQTRQPVEPGWHYGSCYPGDPARLAVYDFLPDSLLGAVANREHFLGVLVADKWMSNADARQSVYFRSRIAQWSPEGGSRSGGTAFVAQMIDHGYAFGGPAWEFADAPLHGMAPRPAVYQYVRGVGDFEPWLSQVASMPPEVLDQARGRIPQRWLEGDGNELDRLLEQLWRRRRQVADLILRCRDARPAWFPAWQ
jgi:hypothetical protein